MDEIEFSSDVKKIIIHQVASALNYLHTRDPKIAHCDVKSENILLDKYKNAKLGDFGLSAVKNAAQTSCSNAGAPPGQGTPRYSAPDVLRGELLSMSWLLMSNIFSLATVVFELLMDQFAQVGTRWNNITSRPGVNYKNSITFTVSIMRIFIQLQLQLHSVQLCSK